VNTVFKRLLLWPLCLLLAAIVTWCLWSLWAYRDIPVDVLEAQYGGDALQRVEVDGVSLAYRVQGRGPPLLLIHSHYFNMRIWDGWIEALADSFTVIRFDMTSHGLTGPEPSDDYSMARDLGLIRGLLAHLKVEEYSVVGSSLGGNMAFHLAAQEPQRVLALVLANSGGLPRENSRGGTIPGWVDYVSYLIPTSAFGSFLQWMIIDDALVTDELVQEFHRMFRREGNRFAEFQRLRGFDIGEPEPLLEAITAPTLILWGEDNPQLPVVQAERFAALLPNVAEVQVIVYPGVGHVIPLEVPALAGDDVKRFLQGVHSR
jgi:pimeloyl-ACP methyl ester carboxylesterase